MMKSSTLSTAGLSGDHRSLKKRLICMSPQCLIHQHLDLMSCIIQHCTKFIRRTSDLKETTLLEVMQGYFQRLQSENDRAVRQRTSTDVAEVPSEQNSTRDSLFLYGGRWHLLPEGFVFPSCPALNMWSMWHLGIAALNIAPLKKLRKQFRCDVDVNKRPLIDKAALVMETIEKIGRRRGLLAAGSEINAANCWIVWGPSFKEYLTYLYASEVLASPAFRPDDLYYTTLHKVHTQKSNGQSRFERNYSTAHPVAAVR